MAEDSGDRRHVSAFVGSIMQRLAISIVLAGLVAGCGQQSPASGEAGGPVAELDFIEAVPIAKDDVAPVAQPRPAAKAEEPAKDAEPADEKVEEAAPARTPSPEPAAASADAASATRRANEADAAPDAAPPKPDQPAPN